jgi:hypothetical protein
VECRNNSLNLVVFCIILSLLTMFTPSKLCLFLIVAYVACMGEVGCMFRCEDWKTLDEMGVYVEDFKMDARKQG